MRKMKPENTAKPNTRRSKGRQKKTSASSVFRSKSTVKKSDERQTKVKGNQLNRAVKLETPGRLSRVISRVALTGLAMIGLYALFLVVFLGWKESYTWASGQDWFNLRTVFVQGQERTTEAEIIRYAGIKLGISILDVDRDRMMLRIKNNPWIKQVQVSRQWPDALRIEIVEYKPVALVEMEKLYYTSESGIPFKIAPGSERDAYVVVHGLSRSDFDDKGFGESKVQQGLALLATYRQHSMAKEAKPVSVTFRNNGFELDVGTGPTTLILGKNEPKEAFDRTLTLWKHFAKNRQTAQVIHLDNRFNPGRVPVRMVSNATN